MLSSSAGSIKKAYYSFALKCHPDKFKAPKEKQEAQELFINITDAYEKSIGKASTTAQYTPPSGYGPEYYRYSFEAAFASKALLRAAEGGNIEATEEAIAEGADVNSEDSLGRTALMWAAHNGHTDIVRLLIAYDADVNHADFQDDTALILASRNGHIDAVRLLIEHEADMNHARSDGSTALTLAMEHGHTNIVGLLIAAGADVNRANN